MTDLAALQEAIEQMAQHDQLDPYHSPLALFRSRVLTAARLYLASQSDKGGDAVKVLANMDDIDSKILQENDSRIKGTSTDPSKEIMEAVLHFYITSQRTIRSALSSCAVVVSAEKLKKPVPEKYEDHVGWNACLDHIAATYKNGVVIK